MRQEVVDREVVHDAGHRTFEKCWKRQSPFGVYQMACCKDSIERGHRSRSWWGSLPLDMPRMHSSLTIWVTTSGHLRRLHYLARSRFDKGEACGNRFLFSNVLPSYSFQCGIRLRSRKHMPVIGMSNSSSGDKTGMIVVTGNEGFVQARRFVHGVILQKVEERGSRGGNIEGTTSPATPIYDNA